MNTTHLPSQPCTPAHRKEGVFISWAAVCTCYLLSPFSQSHPGSSSLLSCFLPLGWLSPVGKEADLPDTMLCLYFSTDHPVATGDSHREPHPATPAALTLHRLWQQTWDRYLFNFLSSIATWMGSLVGSDTWRTLSCHNIIKWKEFSSEIFTLFSRPKVLLLLHFRIDLLALSTLPNKVSPQKRKQTCASWQKKNKQSFKWN